MSSIEDISKEAPKWLTSVVEAQGEDPKSGESSDSGEDILVLPLGFV